MKEAILDKYYPKERTVIREAILNAMEEYAQARLKARGSKSQETFDEVYELLESRLNILGPIKAAEAWNICLVWFHQCDLPRDHENNGGAKAKPCTTAKESI